MMSRWQFYVLNVTSFVLVVLIGLQLLLERNIRLLNERAIQIQATIAKGRQTEPVLKNISMRIAQASENEPRLRELLVKYGMNVTLNVDGKQKNYP